MIDYRLMTFLAVCEEMSFTRAARALHITQPAVSQHIRYLEERYGEVLFEMIGKKLLLTHAGHVLHDAAITMRHDERALIRRMHQKEDDVRPLIFGATLTVGAYMMPRRLSALLKKDAVAQVRMAVENTQTLLARLDRGEIDFAIIEGNYDKDKYDSALFSTEKFIAVCSPDYAFSRPTHALSDLVCERVILREEGSGNREILKRHLEGRNMSLDDFHSQIELGDLEAIKALAIAGCGIAFLYKAAALSELEEKTLVEIELGDFTLWHDIRFVWRRGSVFAEEDKAQFRLLSSAAFAERGKQSD